MGSLKPRRFDRLPDWCEVPISKRTAELCLFWQRTEGDALAILSGTVLIKGIASVKQIEAGCLVLDSHKSDGADRLAQRLRRLTITTSDTAPNYIDKLPPTVEKREQRDYLGNDKTLACAFTIMPHRQCGNRGLFKVEGARGTYCPVHARRTAARVARAAERKAQRRAKHYERNKAEPPAP